MREGGEGRGREGGEGRGGEGGGRGGEGGEGGMSVLHVDILNNTIFYVFVLLVLILYLVSVGLYVLMRRPGICEINHLRRGTGSSYQIILHTIRLSYL